MTNNKTLKNLPYNDIESLVSGRSVNRMPVDAFLSSLEGLTYQEAVGNCELDARSYRWNLETTAAIREGILLAFRK